MRKSPNETPERPLAVHRASAKGEAPERTCILTGEKAGPDQLVRLALSPDGDVLPDVRAKAPGRGAWLGADRATLEAAIAKGRLKGALARAFKGAPLTIPADLAERIDRALEQALLDRLGLEARGGTLLTGSDRIADAARRGKVRLLMHAADAASDGSQKLDQVWRVGNDREGSGEAGTVLPMDRQALSVALGRENVVHVAVTDKRAAARIASFLGRLLHFRGAGASVPEAAEP